MLKAKRKTEGEREREGAKVNVRTVIEEDETND